METLLTMQFVCMRPYALPALFALLLVADAGVAACVIAIVNRAFLQR